MTLCGARSLAGLVFVAYPAGLSLLPAPNVWSAVFFLTLLSLGLDSAMAMFEGWACVVSDAWPHSSPLTRVATNAALCFTGFVLSLVFCTDAGLFYLDLVDHYVSSYGLLSAGMAPSA
jgi:SNF family Na+-dependent transporter